MKNKKMIEKLQNLSVSEAWDYFKELCKDPESEQISTMRSILQDNAKCKYGKRYNFAQISSVDDFRKNIPLTTWDDYIEPSAAMQNGEENTLFAGKPDCFIMTSGTSGKKKLIAETTKSSQCKVITDKLRRNFTINSSPKILEGKILPLVNKAELGYTSSGIPFGTASGLTLINTPQSILQTIAYPLEILKIRDNETIDYLLMRFALSQDVRMIVGNNAAKMEKLGQFAKNNAETLIAEIRTGSLRKDLDIAPEILEKLKESLLPEPERANFLNLILTQNREFLPKNYWPNLKIICCWLSGTVGNSIAKIKNLFPEELQYLDYGYGASEGKFNIPYLPGKSAGTLAIHAGFYEFVPIDENHSHKILMAHQLEVGKEYKLIITNFAGLYRYDMKDIVRVESFTENTPDIVFISKTGDIGNLSGEKLAGSTINKASLVCEKIAKISLKHICAVTINNPPHYLFCIELQDDLNSSFAGDDFKLLLDKELQKDLGYGNKRRDNLLLEPKLQIMAKGWLDHLYEENIKLTGNSITQIKLPVIYDNITKVAYENE